MNISVKNAQINDVNNFINQKSPLTEKNDLPSFQERLVEGLNSVAKSQNSAAEIARNFELGTENDLAKVMVGQQVSSLGFQLTLNVRNKALSAYKDIMNMPV